jgi:putative membrane protein
VVAAQIPYPLLPAGGTARAWLTAAQVLAFFLASTSHALHRRGVTFTVEYVVLTVGLGLAVETVGLRAGWPFGHYAYAHRLGPAVGGVPLVIPLGWSMMSYPALLVGRVGAARLRRGGTTRSLSAAGSRRRPAERAVTALVGGALLAGWDLFLDPRMVAEGHWAWAPGGGPRLNGIPWTNTAGWLVVGVALVALVDLVPDPARDAPGARVAGWPAGDGMPLALLCWTYGSWVLACLAFFGQPAVAMAGGVGMGLPMLVAVGAAARPRRRAQWPTPAGPPGAQVGRRADAGADLP